MTTRIRNPKSSFESFIREILGPELSAQVEASAKRSHLSFERKWLRLVGRKMALR